MGRTSAIFVLRRFTSDVPVDPEASLIQWQDEGSAKDALDRMLLADSMVRLPNHSVMILDRMTMAHGLEARSPFLDHRLAEFAATLPVGLKVRGRSRRWIQMRLAERYLPPEVLRRPKQGFSSALAYMMAGQFRALFARYLPDAHLVGAGFLRRRPVQEMLQAHLAGRTDHGNRLWLLLNAEIWYRIHVEGEPVERLEAEMAAALWPARDGAVPDSRLRSGATAPAPTAVGARAGPTLSLRATREGT